MQEYSRRKNKRLWPFLFFSENNNFNVYFVHITDHCGLSGKIWRLYVSTYSPYQIEQRILLIESQISKKSFTSFCSILASECLSIWLNKRKKVNLRVWSSWQLKAVDDDIDQLYKVELSKYWNGKMRWSFIVYLLAATQCKDKINLWTYIGNIGFPSALCQVQTSLKIKQKILTLSNKVKESLMCCSQVLWHTKRNP